MSLEYSTCPHLTRELVLHIINYKHPFNQTTNLTNQTTNQIRNTTNQTINITNQITPQLLTNTTTNQSTKTTQSTQRTNNSNHSSNSNGSNNNNNFQWLCCHCYQNFYSIQNRIEHFNETKHYLYLFKRDLRDELYCNICNDFQYSNLYDSLTIVKKNKVINRVIGFINMGSTCFLSSVLQVLLFNPILVRFFELADIFVDNCRLNQSIPSQSCLFCELYKLFKIVNKYSW